MGLELFAAAQAPEPVICFFSTLSSLFLCFRARWGVTMTSEGLLAGTTASGVVIASATDAAKAVP